MSPRVSPASCLSDSLAHFSLAKVLVRRCYLGAQEQVANFLGFVLLFSMRLKMSFLFIDCIFYIHIYISICIYHDIYHASHFQVPPTTHCVPHSQCYVAITAQKSSQVEPISNTNCWSPAQFPEPAVLL